MGECIYEVTNLMVAYVPAKTCFTVFKKSILIMVLHIWMWRASTLALSGSLARGRTYGGLLFPSFLARSHMQMKPAALLVGNSTSSALFWLCKTTPPVLQLTAASSYMESTYGFSPNKPNSTASSVLIVRLPCPCTKLTHASNA